MTDDEQHGREQDGRPEVKRIGRAPASFVDSQVPWIAARCVVVGEIDVAVERQGADEDPRIEAVAVHLPDLLAVGEVAPCVGEEHDKDGQEPEPLVVSKVPRESI